MATAQSSSGTWLFVAPWDLHHPGGVNQVIESLFDANVRVLRNRSLLLIKSWKARRPNVVRIDGRRTIYGHCRSPWDKKRPVLNALAFLLELPAALARFRRLLRLEHVARINVHFPGLDALIWLIVRAMLPTRPQIILSFHGADLNLATRARGMTRRLWIKLLTSADEIVFCSDQLRLEFEHAFGPMRHLRVIDNGVDPELIAVKTAAPSPIEVPQKCIVSLATYEDKKGLDVLLQAFESVALDDPDVQLVIAGRVTSADMFEGLELQRQQLRHGDRVQLLRDVDHGAAMRLLQHAHVFVLPSRSEPFGIAVLEAGALGRPVIATSACGVAQRLSDGIDLLIVPPDDAPALANAIERVLHEDVLAELLATSLRRRVYSDFTWARIVHRYAALGTHK
ncbi:MAG TPA: glycosyltransferase family 4 protein [Burkholderiaceae bacterium]|nr:glycosyltransferase family 4 protein [Burkholderiaceae bacterium]